MRIAKVLVLYKRSVYKNYFLNKTSSIRHRFSSVPPAHQRRLEQVHQEHYATLQIVENGLRAARIPYIKSNRGRSIDYSSFNLIITVGGDGTFLEGARNIRRQLIVGVNSSPQWSVGNFCVATAQTFPAILRAILTGTARVRLLPRLRVHGIRELKGINVLNDILIAHVNPAATSRYAIQVGRQQEEQRSSGVWISTAAGSTGAIRSAGGEVLPAISNKFQFFCRELYRGKTSEYQIRKGILSVQQRIRITSFMREGMIFMDGSRLSVPFPFGAKITIEHSPDSLHTVRQ